MEEKHEEEMPADDESVRIFTEFTDLLNEKGADSAEVKAFMKKYSDNKELTGLLETAILVKKASEAGDIE
jgi:hypothetical protein